MSPVAVTTTTPDNARTLAARRQLLTERRHAEAARAVELQQQVSELEAEAAERLVAGDLATYDAAAVQLDRLRPQLVAATRSTEDLDAALQKVHTALQHAEWEAELHTVSAAAQAATATVAEQLDEQLPPLLDQLREVLLTARRADESGRLARIRADQLRVSLGRQDHANPTAGGQSRYDQTLTNLPELRAFTGGAR